MERRSAHSTVNAAYSIIQLNTVVAWEKELYVNVWTSPRMVYSYISAML